MAIRAPDGANKSIKPLATNVLHFVFQVSNYHSTSSRNQAGFGGNSTGGRLVVFYISTEPGLQDSFDHLIDRAVQDFLGGLKFFHMIVGCRQMQHNQEENEI